MTGRARFRIGGLGVEVIRRDGGTVTARPAHEPFREDGAGTPPDLTVTALPGPCPHTPSDRRFECDRTWSLRETEGGLLFVPAGERGTAWISASFRQVRVYGLEPDAPVLDYPLDEMLFVHLLPDTGALLLHASAVVWNGRALCFPGVSGTGKSTMATLWASARAAPVLSDDRVVLRVRGGRLWCHGTPWHGTAGRALGLQAPVEGIYLLAQSPQAYRRPAPAASGVARLLRCLFLPHWDGVRAARALEALDRAVARVPLEEVGFWPHPACLDSLFPETAH